MSKIGKEPIKFDSSKVKVNIEKGGTYNGSVVKVEGPKGVLEQPVRRGIDIKVENDVITLEIKKEHDKPMHGLFRSLIANMVEGVTNGFEKKLEIHGVGYRGSMKGNGVSLSLGFSHAVDYSPREGVTLTMPDETTIVISGIDKQKVGQVAAEIRELRKPEPYKGKGIRYEGEQVKRKAGKSASA